jgi:hypothetical protein
VIPLLWLTSTPRRRSLTRIWDVAVGEDEPSETVFAGFHEGLLPA